MLERKIEALVSHVKTQMPIFGNNGFLQNPYQDSDNQEEGVNDYLDSYFFIQLIPNALPEEYSFEDDLAPDCIGDMKVSTELILVAGMNGVKKYEAIQVLTAAIKSFPGLNSLMLSASTNSENIYQWLYAQPYPSSEKGLIMLRFFVTDHFVSMDCGLEICGDCCGNTDTCFCNCS